MQHIPSHNLHREARRDCISHQRRPRLELANVVVVVVVHLHTPSSARFLAIPGHLDETE